MTRIGIMQGRLVPPVEDRIQAFPRSRWADEFALADAAGLDCIEWIYDEFGADVNPIATDEGVEQILALAERHRVAVVSLCADYFMDRPLVRATAPEREERVQHLEWLLRRCGRLGIERVVLPFVDASRIETDGERLQTIEIIQSVLATADTSGIELHLETSLGPALFAELLSALSRELVKVNYDIGNSASLGYDPSDEFAAYGDRVGSVHIKDRRRGRTTVELGSGDADFSTVFDGLRALSYRGDLVLQVARGVPGDEVEWARRNRSTVERFVAEAALRGAA